MKCLELRTMALLRQRRDASRKRARAARISLPTLDSLVKSNHANKLYPVSVDGERPLWKARHDLFDWMASDVSGEILEFFDENKLYCLVFSTAKKVPTVG